ncbi:uncharacterized protein TRIADDRAFT_20786, partial [Trichoplax adhaerens]
VIIYNRVPKTGSTSVMALFYDLCKINKFRVLHLNVSKNSHVMHVADQGRFIRNITSWSKMQPAIFHGHLAYLDFEKYGAFNRPIYINVLRKPLDRLVSFYYFLRYGDDFRPHLHRRKMGDKITFDECVAKNLPDCRPEKLWLQIPFFCGHHTQCWIPGNEWALQQAKHNLFHKYLLVGVTEDLTGFINVLEATLPKLFKGATNRFLTFSKSHARKTKYKLPPSEATINAMQKSKIWKMENEFYEFALAIFQRIKESTLVKGKKLNDKTIGRKVVQQKFFYDKIRPKVGNPRRTF